MALTPRNLEAVARCKPRVGVSARRCKHHYPSINCLFSVFSNINGEHESTLTTSKKYSWCIPVQKEIKPTIWGSAITPEPWNRQKIIFEDPNVRVARLFGSLTTKTVLLRETVHQTSRARGRGRATLPLGTVLLLQQRYCRRISTALPLVNTLESMDLYLTHSVVPSQLRGKYR